MSAYRIAVLASGSGTLFQSLIDSQEVHQGELVGLITDVVCPAIDRASQAGIPHKLIPLTDDRKKWDENLAVALVELNPDLIVAAGFMRIIGPMVLKKYAGQIINTHPALLPRFPGANAVSDALAAGEKITGSTIHFVDAGVDTGEIIAQTKVDIFESDDVMTLHSRIKIVERNLLVDVVAKFVSGHLQTKAGS